MQNLILISKDDLKDLLTETIDERLGKHLHNIPRSESNEKYLTREEASNLLQICLSTLNSWTKENIIPVYRIGRFVRYKASDIDNALKDIRGIKYSRYKR